MILQKLKYPIESPLQMAENYFSVISVLNNLKLARREIQLLAFTAVRGNIASETSKRDFVKQYGSSLATVGNIMSKLSKSKLLVKKDRVISVNKALMLDFDEDIVLGITLEYVNK